MAMSPHRGRPVRAGGGSAAPAAPGVTDRESFGPARFLNGAVVARLRPPVLELADDASLPLLERSKFLAIFSTGLDEYFQVRVAGLKNRLTPAGAGAQPTAEASSRSSPRRARR